MSEIVLGVVLLSASLAAVTTLVIISRSTINRIADRGSGTAREILNEPK